MATATGDYSWSQSNPSSGLIVSTTVKFFCPATQSPTIDSASVLSCNPSSGTANAQVTSFTAASLSGVKRQEEVQWEVTVQVNVYDIVPGPSRVSSGSGQVQVFYSLS